MKKGRRREQRGKYKIRRKAAPIGSITVTPADPKRTDDEQMVIPDFEIEAMARILLPALRAFYASPEGQAAFEKWKRNQEHT